MVRLVDGEAGLAASTIKRRLATVSSLFEYLFLRGLCGAFGIEETRHVIDHANLTQASSQASTLWPRQPINHDAPPPPRPKLPSTGWFGSAARRHRGSDA